jgi:hypothetical protein
MNSDIEKLQGTWSIVSLEIDGAIVSAPALGLTSHPRGGPPHPRGLSI